MSLAPRTAVLVLNFDGLRHLGPCLQSLAALDVFVPGEAGRPRDAAAADGVWVVDNGSSDGSVDWVRRHHPWAGVIPLADNLGFSRAYNRAAAGVDAEWIVFLNNDTRVDPGWLRALHAAAARHPEAAAVAGRILSWDGRLVDFVGADTFFFGHAAQRGLGLPAAGLEVREQPLLFGCAGALMVRRRAFLDLGGFDPDYFSFLEDVDLGWRANALGHATWLAPDAVTYHRLHGTWGAGVDAAGRFLLERNALCNLVKNYGEDRMGVLLLTAAALTLLRGFAVSGPLRDGGDPLVSVDALAHLAALAALTPLRRALAARRAEVQRRRVRSDDELFPLFGDLASPPLPYGERYGEAFDAARRLAGVSGGAPPSRWAARETAAAAAAAAELSATAAALTARFREPAPVLRRGEPLDRTYPLRSGEADALLGAVDAAERWLRGGPGAEASSALADRAVALRRCFVESTRGSWPPPRGGRAETGRREPAAQGPALPKGRTMGETMYPSERPSARIRTGVVIRTKDRPAFLRDALASVAAQDLRPVELVLVNDGGEDPGPVLDGLRAELEGIRVVRVDHPRSVGRSPAAQSGLEAAGADFVTFLDDDDALLPHHLSTLAGPVETAGALVSYADVECLTVEAGETGRRTVLHRAVFASEFDPSRLFFENYIPIMAVLMDRQLALDAGGFDPELEYFEDWDLWLRLARRTPFHHCPEVTATYYVCPEAGQGRGTGGEHRWPHMARLFDKHRGQVHGTDWVDYFRTYVEPTRERLVALETRWPELHDAAEAADRLRAIESSRSWRTIQRLRRLLGRS